MSDDYVEDEIDDEYEEELEYDEDEDDESNDIEDLDLIEDNDTSILDASQFYNKNDYETITKLETELVSMKSTTEKKINKYEYTSIIGYRAQELANGAQSFIDTTGMDDVIDIAEEEFNQGKIALIIKRPLPDGTYEYHRVCDLRR